jgi:excisionase family DNA binding protein
VSAALDDREALTVAEVARELRLSEKTVRRAIASGDLAAHKLCAHWRIFRGDVEAWIAAGSNVRRLRTTKARRASVQRRQRGSLRSLELSRTEGAG